jgi:hypothetical protein
MAISLPLSFTYSSKEIEEIFYTALQELRDNGLFADPLSRITIFGNEIAYPIPPSKRKLFLDYASKFYFKYELSCDILMDNGKEYLIIRKFHRDFFKMFSVNRTLV